MKKVYIGDPCYVISADNWQSFCDMIDDGGNMGVIFDFMGNSVYVMQTKWGDGVYELFDSRYSLVGELCVDSGLLCVMCVEGVQNVSGIEDGCVVEVDEFSVDSVYNDDDKTFYVGEYFVKTDYFDEEDEEDDESYDYDDDDN